MDRGRSTIDHPAPPPPGLRHLPGAAASGPGCHPRASGPLDLRPSAFLLALFLVPATSCGGRVSPVPAEEKSPEQVVADWFREDLSQCSTDADCPTGRCDLSPAFAVSLSNGYCAAFPTAFDRWQRDDLARLLARRAAADGAVRTAVLERLDRELALGVLGAELEAVVLTLGHLGGDEAVARLRMIRDSRSGPVRRLAGLALASAGDAAATDDVVDAAFSSSANLRMHAAEAAAGLCNEAALGLLAELVRDRVPLVRQAAAAGLARCGGPRAREILKQRLREFEAGEGRDGDRYPVEAALERCGE